MSDERHETVADNVSVNHQFHEIAKMIPHEEVDVSKMETTTPTREKSSAVGNEAAMREALEKVRFYLPYFFQYMRIHREDEEGGGYYEKILEVVNAALSAPPRNCDFGTAEEQMERFFKFCTPQRCDECKSHEHEDDSFYGCVLRWSQMQYEEAKK